MHLWVGKIAKTSVYNYITAVSSRKTMKSLITLYTQKVLSLSGVDFPVTAKFLTIFRFHCKIKIGSNAFTLLDRLELAMHSTSLFTLAAIKSDVSKFDTFVN